MTYDEAVQWLYSAVPNFQRDGGSKNYKIGLEGPQKLWSYLENPSIDIPTIHVAGTNNVHNLILLHCNYGLSNHLLKCRNFIFAELNSMRIF